jgi:hypothetical protein
MKKVWIEAFIILIAAISILLLFIWGASPQTEEDLIVNEFLNDVVNDNYKPSNINMTNRLTQDNRADGSRNQYGLIWYKNNEKFYAVLHYNDLEKTGVSDLYFIAFSNDLPDVLNEETASLYFNRYFKTSSFGEINCDIKSGISYCEAFWEGNNKNKMGMGVINSPNYKMVIFCEYPIGSVNYGLSTCMQTL